LADIHTDHILQQQTPNDKKRALQAVPKDLHATYEMALQAIRAKPEEDRELALQTLRWIVNAQRPLQFAELQVALAIQDDHEELDEDDFIQDLDIIEQCASLVILDQETGTIRLDHYTVQEYLLSVPILQDDAHLTIAKTCITFLSLNCFKEGLPKEPNDTRAIEMGSFLDYSCRYLGYHCRTSDETRDLVKRIHGLMGNKTFLCSIIRKLHNLWAFQLPKVRPLYVACILGLPRVASALITDDTLEEHMTLALHLAAFHGREEMVRLLLDNGVDIHAVHGGGNVLCRAAKVGHEGVVRLLLGRGADFNAHSGRWGSALDQAITVGREDVVRLLLDRGADCNGHAGHYTTPLRIAAISGRVEIIRVLLDRGADVNAQGGIWGSARGSATDSGRLEAVRLLLDRGAEVNAPAGIHRNALAVALHHGHDEMVLLLREHGAKEVVI
jgi:hypothetical protein